jgi:hypothetical protein
MRLISAKKGAVVIAAALTMFLALGTPASANTVAVTITGGSLTAAGNTFDLAPGGGNTPPCDEKADALNATFNAGGTGSITGSWSSMFQLGTPPSGQFYQADFTVLAGAFTWTLTSAGPPTWTYSVASTAPNHLIIRANIYRIASGSCAKTDLACTITVKLSFTGTVTSTTALPTYTPGSITITAASVSPHIAVASCSAPFASWSGQTASATMNLT